MKYIVNIMKINDKFTYRLEAVSDKSDFIYGETNNFFTTKELAVEDARRQLKRNGVDELNCSIIGNS